MQLCQRMIDEMTVRRYSEHTQKDYLRRVRRFAAFLGRSSQWRATPDKPAGWTVSAASREKDLTSLGLSAGARLTCINVAMVGLV